MEDKIKHELDLVDKASDNFKEIITESSETEYTKLQTLGTNLYGTSIMYKKELFKRGRTSYKYASYKYGTIVMVNFGTNIGDELCGNHFAIVLTNNDNPYSSVLTVLPLSSKNKANRLSLGELLSKILDDIVLMINEVNEKERKKELEFFKKESEFREYLHNFEDSISIESSEVEVQNAIKVILNYNDKESTSTINEYLVLQDKFSKELKEIHKNHDKIRNLLKVYINKNRITYAIIDQIQTISKFRILKPINDLNPIANLEVDMNKMAMIENKIISRYFSKANKYLDKKGKEC